MQKLKKIGIISVFENLNYGSVFQAMALQTIVRSLGYHPVHLRWKRQNETPYREARHFCRRFLDSAFGRHLNKQKQLRYEFDRFRRNYIEQSKPVSSEKLTSFNDQYDAFICGSDQIWAPNQFRTEFFLDFVKNNRRKIAYAPSVGIPSLPEELRREYRRMILAIPHLSIREDEGSSLLSRELGVRNVPVVLDPTLLLTADSYPMPPRDTCVKRIGKESDRQGYVLTYFLSENENHCKGLLSFAQSMGLRIVKASLHASQNCCCGLPVSIETVFAGPSEFLSLISKAEYVVTDSFHGCVFSLLFHRPFFVFERFSEDSSINQNSRVHCLLKFVDLMNRCVEYNSCEIPDTVSPINFTLVDKVICERREFSIGLLKRYLENAVP